MKRILAFFLMICVLGLSAGCTKKDTAKENKPVPTAQVAYAAYQYEDGYRLSEGWMYDMTISAEAQLRELEKLVGAMKLTIRDEMFEHGRGYHLTFFGADGTAEKELLILEDGLVSKEGMMYDAQGSDALLAWLDRLEIDQQDVE